MKQMEAPVGMLGNSHPEFDRWLRAEPVCGLRCRFARSEFAHKTLADVDGNLSKVTTYRQPDPRMYQYSVDQALLTGKPILLEFATPGHCTNCDEQLQMLRAIMDKYQDQMIFIHIDQYANPQAYKAYKVMGDPWTFIIDKNGVVQFEQAGRMLIGEMNYALKKTL